MSSQIKRLPDGRPQFTVQGHEPLSKKGGCWTFTVYNHAAGIIVHGPTTLSQEAAAACERFSLGADIALLPAAVDGGVMKDLSNQLRMEV